MTATVGHRHAAMPVRPAPLAYVGLATRTIAFALDWALLTGAAVLTVAAVGVSLAALGVPNAVRTVAEVIAGALFVVATIGFFTVFWSTTGQTPGSRALRIRVCDASGEVVGPARAALRCLALVLATLPLLAGLLLILVDDRRRGLHDMLAGTVVVDARDR